jgi:pyruvate-formate lyase
MPLTWLVTFVPMSGASVFYGINICGTTPDGQDASNDLSCIMIEALANTRLSQPPLAVRYHRNISPDVVERAIDLDRVGDGHPSWINEDLLEKWGLLRGWPEDVAKNTQLAGCVANHVKGKCGGIGGVEGVGNMILPMVLEDALYQGSPPMRAPKEIGVPRPRTKDPREMMSSEELLEAVLEWTDWYSRISIVSWNTALQVLEEWLPDPCNSMLLEDPLDRGIDAVKMAKEHDTMPFIYPMGQQNLADSLAAVQKLVFDDRKYTMEEMLGALKANWVGYEEMRQDFLNAPKYGNDDDFADDWMAKVKVGIDRIFTAVSDAWGNTLIPDGSTAAGYQMVGFGCGATPDGRRGMTYLADGSLSPMPGADRSGPTAVLNSAGKVPYFHTDLFNMRVMPQFLEKENRVLFAEYLREWYEKGNIFHIQFNVVNTEELREAQEKPKDYSDLQVRVAGYSAFFVDLPQETQDSIIARTEHCFT